MPLFKVDIAAWLVPIMAFSVCWIILHGLMQRATRLPIDHPNARSLHAVPIPRIGGIGIIAGVLIASVFIPSSELWLFMLGALALAAISLLDDYKNLPVHGRLLAHIIVAIACVLKLPSVSGVSLFIASLAIVWMTNLYNFMDGADGLAGGMAAIGFGALSIAAGGAGALDLTLLNAAIAGAALAFLYFNFPPARLFMGDAGSVPLGFLAATIGVYGAAQKYWPALFPVMVFSPFIFDASITLLKRALRVEKVWQAHREHYYQRLVRMGWSHRGMTLSAYALMLLCAAIALVYLHQPEVLAYASMLWLGVFLIIFIAIDWRWAHYQHEI